LIEKARGMGENTRGATVLEAPAAPLTTQPLQEVEMANSPSYTSYNATSSTTERAPYAWREYPIDGIRSEYPAAGGCYAFIGDGRLLLIGQTSNLRIRMPQYDVRHGLCGEYFTPWGQFNRLTLKIKVGRRFGEWAMRELRLIRRLRPSCNRRLG
jgi:hypothetical protein